MKSDQLKPDQLPLAMRWPQQQRFETYLEGDNGIALALLHRAVDEADANWAFLSGPPASGKTHLLIAACAAVMHGRTAQYLSLRSSTLRGDAADAIRAFGGSDLLAIDDIDALAGDREAEHALFDLYNRCKTEKVAMLFAAVQPPAHLGIGLPDLISRLSSCAQAVLRPLNDVQRREVLRSRAQVRGIELDDVAIDWLFARAQRDLGSLTDLLDKIDHASLAAKRRVTIPFLRELIGGSA